MCHADPDFKGSFQNGELFSLYVDSGEYEQSVHGPAGLNCVACHTDLSRYPHHTEEQVTCIECHGEDGGTADTSYATLRVTLPYADHREMTLAKNESCRSCHEQEYEVAGPSAHVKVFEGGNRDSALCIDCHGSHDIPHPEEPRAKIAQICGDCHEAVYSTYRSSVHGAALEADSNPDVPTCVDCHGVHNVRGPRDPSYRNDSIVICGGCHGDTELMAEYGISTDVLKTYLSDFHGRTVDLFRRFDIDTPSDKAVCFDCHGIHNIRRVDDPLSTVHTDNVLQTCQLCHKDARPNFTSSWLAHDLPTWEDDPALSAVNLAYSILTPLTIGGFLTYIGLDVGKRWFDKRRTIRRAQALAAKELENDFDEI
jgi:predicted CXXCH cytochrome family protein